MSELHHIALLCGLKSVPHGFPLLVLLFMQNQSLHGVVALTDHGDASTGDAVRIDAGKRIGGRALIARVPRHIHIRRAQHQHCRRCGLQPLGLCKQARGTLGLHGKV